MRWLGYVLRMGFKVAVVTAAEYGVKAVIHQAVNKKRTRRRRRVKKRTRR
jgi:hypothetical protein